MIWFCTPLSVIVLISISTALTRSSTDAWKRALSEKASAVEHSQDRGYTSRFYGVSMARRKKRSSDRWQAEYTNAEGRTVFIGEFDEEEEAARAYNDVVEAKKLEQRMNPEGADGRLEAKPIKSSAYYGVSWQNGCNKWEAYSVLQKRLGFDGNRKYLGVFDDEREAARSVDESLREFIPDIAAYWVNFPTRRERHKLDVDEGPALAAANMRSKKSGSRSRFLGVSWIIATGRWRATYYDADKRYVHVGFFDYEEEAARAYNASVRETASPSPTNPVGSDGRLVPKLETSSQYYGVSWQIKAKKWHTQVYRKKALGLDGKRNNLGCFKDERRAAKEVDSYVRRAMPSVAAGTVNFPTLDELKRRRFKVPRRVWLTREHSVCERTTLAAWLTDVKPGKAPVRNCAYWSYRVMFDDAEVAAWAGLEAREPFWDSLIGDDTAFVGVRFGLTRREAPG